jgi:5'-nucleotidase
VQLTVLHTNDLHGRLDALPRLASLIQHERALARAEGRRVLLLDAGDSSAKSSPESKATGGRANFVVLDAIGYQAATLGNRDVKFGARALQGLIQAVSFPILAANLVRLEDATRPAVAGLQSHAVFSLDSLPVGVIGLTAWTGYDYAKFGYRAVNGLGRLRDLIARLQGDGVRTILLLSHLGHALDRRVAAAVKGLTAIVGGHSHVALDPPRAVYGVPVAQAGEYGQALGRLDLTLGEETGRALEFAGRLIPCGPDTPPDGTIAATLELVREEVARVTAEHAEA